MMKPDNNYAFVVYDKPNYALYVCELLNGINFMNGTLAVKPRDKTRNVSWLFFKVVVLKANISGRFVLDESMVKAKPPQSCRLLQSAESHSIRAVQSGRVCGQ